MVRKLFIAPSEIPVGSFTRCVHVPASQQWLAVYNAALLQAANPNNYEQLRETDLTPEDAAARGMQIYADWLLGDCSLDCDDVLACLDPVLADLLRSGAVNPNAIDPSDTTLIETRFPTASRAVEILPPPVDCDKDELWAGLLEIAERIDQNGRDFWQTVVAEVDTIERIAEIIALVPLFGDIVGEGLELLAEIAPDMLNQYESHSSPAVVEAIACDLFQTVCAECRYPTYQEVFDYFSGKSALGAQAWTEIAFDALVDILIGTSGASDAIVYFTTNILQMYVIAAGATWLRTIGVKFIALWAKIGAAVPSSAWELLCGACGGEVWEADFDFTIDMQGWTIRPNGYGVWTAQGVAGTLGSYYTLQITHPWVGPFNITQMICHFNSTNIHLGNFSAGMRTTPAGTPFDFITSAAGVEDQPYDLTFNGDIDRTGALIFVYGANRGDQEYLTSIHMEGKGPNPFA